MTANTPPIPERPQAVHLLGICGTAMTALAGCLQAQGKRVTGSDAHPYPPMSDHLRTMGIAFCEGYAPENIPPDTDLVVVGNVIQESNPEAGEMRRRGLPFISMAAAVKRFAIGARHAITVAGTHGKTTTTALAAHVLTELGADPGFLLGGIARNFDTNFRQGDGALFVIEGDEYDTAYFDKTPKFFKYEPRTLIFTSLEFDHGDIYPDLDAIRAQFEALLRGLPADGRLIASGDDPNVADLLHAAPCPVTCYGFDKAAHHRVGGDITAWRIADWRADGEGAAFTLLHGGAASAWRVPLPGRHNARNAAAVIALASALDYPAPAIQAALDSFKGVKRRQEVRGEEDGVTVIDDFAHHPTAVGLTIEAMRERYPGRRLWAVLEPRSFTARGTRFQAEFTEALRGAERVLLARPFSSDYSAGVPLLDTGAIAATLNGNGTGEPLAEALDTTEALLARLTSQTRPGDVVLIMSNGGFNDIHTRLLDALKRRVAQPSPQPQPAAGP